MSLPLASAHLSDEEFLRAFHSCQLKTSEFRHADHLRLAWLHLQREPLEEALANVRTAIQKFAEHHGVTGLYHETVTQAWVRLLATHREATFAEKPLSCVRRIDRLPQDFERNAAACLEVFRFVHRTHSSPSQQAQHTVVSKIKRQERGRNRYPPTGSAHRWFAELAGESELKEASGAKALARSTASRPSRTGSVT